MATGKTGILLAKRFTEFGAKVTLILGPAGGCCLNNKIRLIRFNFFNELKDKIIAELKNKRYDILIHSAAVSDYQPRKFYNKKIKSKKKIWKLNLVPTIKIIDLIKKINPKLFLVGFKFEPSAKKEKLIREAKTLLENTPCDLVVGNTLRRGDYYAYIISNKDIYGPAFNRKSLVEKLIERI